MLPPKRLLIEELPPLRDVRLRVRLSAPPKSVELVPSQQPLVWRYDGGVLTLTVPRVDVHEVLPIG